MAEFHVRVGIRFEVVDDAAVVCDLRIGSRVSSRLLAVRLPCGRLFVSPGLGRGLLVEVEGLDPWQRDPAWREFLSNLREAYGPCVGRWR